MKINSNSVCGLDCSCRSCGTVWRQARRRLRKIPSLKQTWYIHNCDQTKCMISKVLNRAIKRARVDLSSTSGSPTSATLVGKEENVFMNIALDHGHMPSVNSKTAFLEGVSQMYCSIFQFPFQELPNLLEQCGCDVKIMIDLKSIDSL